MVSVSMMYNTARGIYNIAKEVGNKINSLTIISGVSLGVSLLNYNANKTNGENLQPENIIFKNRTLESVTNNDNIVFA
ncbi:hypothetical protein KAI32_03710 [Candidatus Pacearchaeota archaeon]|nr:hypothetical protein [Candidatus Pacearchaeota archaeon]